MSEKNTIKSDALFSVVLKNIEKAVKARLPKLKTVETMAGRFTVDDLKKGGIPAPAVLLSLTHIRTGKSHLSGALKYEMYLTAFVITKDTLGLPRDEAALNISQALLSLIQNNRFGHELLGSAEKLSIESLINSKVRSFTQSLWAVSWVQPFVMEPVCEGETDPALYIDLSVNGETYDRKIISQNEGGQST